jgi:hypothetical protein
MTLRIIAMFFIGVVVSLCIAVSQIDLETLRGEIDSALESATGMPVEVRGKIRWKFSLTPSVELGDVVIKSQDWAKNPDGIKIKSVGARLNLLSLLGTPRINDLILSVVDVDIQKNDKGEYSIGVVDSDSVQGKESALPEYLVNTNIGINSVLIKKLSVQVSTDTKTENYALDEFFIESEKRKDIFQYDGYIHSKEHKYSFVVSMSKLDAARGIYPLRVAIQSRENRFSSDIAIDAKSKLPIDFVVSGDVRDAAQVAKLFDLDLIKIAPMTISISGGMDYKKFTIHKSSFATGKNNIGISGEYIFASKNKKKPTINMTIKSSGFNVGQVFPNMYGPNKKPWVRPNRPLNAFQDTPLYTEYLDLFDGEIKISCASLVPYRDMLFSDINAKVSVRDGKLVVRADTGFADGMINLSVRGARDKNGIFAATAAGQGIGVKMGQILSGVRENNIITGLPLLLEFYLRSRGNNLSDLMANINGPVRVRNTAGGVALPDIVDYLYGQDFITSLRHSVHDMVDDKNKYDKVHISCAVANLKIRNGRTETERGVAVQTNAVNMRAAGFVDLGAERIQTSFVSTPVRGIKLSITGNVVNSLEFDGDLAEPDIKFDGGAMVSRTAATAGLGMLLLAPFTGGLSLVAGAGVGYLAGDLLNNWLADDHPCNTAMDKGAPAAKGDPDFMNTDLESLVKNELGK